MRKLLGALVLLLGIVSIAMTARYGWKQADNEVDQVMAAVMYGTIALCAIIFDGVAIRLWINGWRKVGAFIGVVAALAFVVTFSNSLGSIASRADAVQDRSQHATDSRDDNRRELKRLERELEKLGTYTPTDAAAVKAAQDAAAAATAARQAECGNGDPKQRGKFCRQKEDAEGAANTTLSKSTAAKATTDRAREIEAKVAEVRDELDGSDGTVNPVGSLAKALSNIFPGLGEGVTSKMQAIIALVFELCIVGMMIAFEALGHPVASKLAPRHAIQAEVLRPAPVAPQLQPSPRRVAQKALPKSAKAERDASAEAARFAKASLVPQPDGRVYLRDLPSVYGAWCQQLKQPPLPGRDMAAALNELFKSAGLQSEGAGLEMVVVGIEWKPECSADTLH